MNIRSFLKDIEIFKGLVSDDLNTVADICLIKKFTEGESVFSKDDAPEDMYVLKSGRCDVKIAAGGVAETYTIYALNPGDIFGEVGFVDGSSRSATVKCAKECEVIALPREAFATLCGDKPQIGHIVMKNIAVILAKRLRETDEEFKNFYFQRRTSFRSLFHTG